MLRGRPRTINFHLTGIASGGSATTELRAGPRHERPFIIRSVEVVPVGGVSVGQYVDVFVCGADWPGDTVGVPGVSIFEAQQAVGDLPVEDRPLGLPVTSHHYDVPMAFEVLESSRVLMVQAQFVAPAAALPQLHVVVVIEEFDTLGDPVIPRPPIGPPPIEVRPPAAPPLGPDDAPPVVPPPYVPPPSGPPVVPPPTLGDSYRRYTTGCLAAAYRTGVDAYKAAACRSSRTAAVLKGAEARAFDAWYIRTALHPTQRR